MRTYSSTVCLTQSSSLAIAEYSSLYALATDFACSKHTFGKRLGKSVTGAVVANAPDGSVSAGTYAVVGRTAKPLAIDQSLRFVSKYLLCSSSRSGG